MKFGYFAIGLILLSGNFAVAQHIRYAERQHEAPRLPFEQQEAKKERQKPETLEKSLPDFANSRFRIASRIPKPQLTEEARSAREILTPVSSASAPIGNGLLRPDPTTGEQGATINRSQSILTPHRQPPQFERQTSQEFQPQPYVEPHHGVAEYSSGLGVANSVGNSGVVWRNPYFPNSRYFNGVVDPNRPADFYRVEISNWASENNWGEGAGPPQGPALSFNYFDCNYCDDWRCFCSGAKNLGFDCTCRGPSPCPGDCPGNPTSVLDKINCRTCVGKCSCRKRPLKTRVTCETCGPATSTEDCNRTAASRGILGDLK